MISTHPDLPTALLKPRGSLCISLYLPTEIGADSEQNRIRLKSLLKQARTLLDNHGCSAGDAKSYLEPLHAYHTEQVRRAPAGGLGLFRSPDWFEYIHLPSPVEELAVVGSRFHIRPLLPLSSAPQQFYILCLAKNNIRLFGSERHTLQELHVSDMPGSLAEAMRYDDPEKQLQHHSGSGAGQHAVFHGQGASVDAEKTQLLRCFQQVDNAVCNHLQSARKPLIPAGVEYMVSMYREANHYPHLLDTHIEGSPEHTEEQALHARALELLQPDVTKRMLQAVDLYRQAAGTSRAARDISTVVEAARQGRVDTLLLTAGPPVWGCVDEASGNCYVHESPEKGDEDLLNAAAVETLRTGGTVYVPDNEHMPEPGRLAAVLRY